MSSRVTFGDIHKLLAEFGFERRKVEGKPYVMFEHEPTGVLFLFRQHRAAERIDSMNLASVRLHLVQNGFLTDAAFDKKLDRLGKSRTQNARKK